jgi:hypothetical protein
VEQTTLQGGYDETAKAWKARFGTPYSVCGCMVDASQEKSVEKSKEKPNDKGKAPMKNMFKLVRNLSENSSKTSTPTRYGTHEGHPDLTPSGIEDADSSHPSDHNLHRESTAEGVAQLDRIARQMMSKERASNVLQGNGKAVFDEWQKLQAERKQTRTDHSEAFTEDGDGRYNAYWGVSANVPFG